MTTPLGHGTTITFSSGFVAKILSMDLSGIERAAVPDTTFETVGGKEFVPSDTYDPGEISVVMQHDVDKEPPIEGAAETVTITFAGGGRSVAGTGFMTGYEISFQDEEKVQGTARIKFSGDLTWTII